LIQVKPQRVPFNALARTWKHRANDQGASSVKAKTPIATVRSKLARRAADATDALAVDGTTKPAGAAETAVAATWDGVVHEVNSKLPTGARR
jgi:hypothetical protein